MSVDSPTASSLLTAAGAASATDPSLADTSRSQSQLRRNLKRFLIGNRLNFIGLCLVVLFFFLAVFGEAIAPHDPYAQDITGSKRLSPSITHPMGTDELGRDILSRVMAGTRISLQVAVVVLTFAVVFGTIVGSIAGYFGGIVDEVLMRFTDIIYGMPFLPFIIVLIALFGRSKWFVMLAIVLIVWRTSARVVRAQTMALKQRQ
ncbi:MAG: ABC transporter permease, partial [Thermomicrobiales bacterium]|nr:ABC transporter permease [Thermomicrobiales bacterium]